MKGFTEALAHELRNTAGARITAHLPIPGFVFTDLTRCGRTDTPHGARTPGQTADVFLGNLNRSDFCILCPDNEVPRTLDGKRIARAAGDVVENRPALSRWHPDWAEPFADCRKRP